MRRPTALAASLAIALLAASPARAVPDVELPNDVSAGPALIGARAFISTSDGTGTGTLYAATRDGRLREQAVLPPAVLPDAPAASYYDLVGFAGHAAWLRLTCQNGATPGGCSGEAQVFSPADGRVERSAAACQPSTFASLDASNGRLALSDGACHPSVLDTSTGHQRVLSDDVAVGVRTAGRWAAWVNAGPVTGRRYLTPASLTLYDLHADKVALSLPASRFGPYAIADLDVDADGTMAVALERRDTAVARGRRAKVELVSVGGAVSPASVPRAIGYRVRIDRGRLMAFAGASASAADAAVPAALYVARRGRRTCVLDRRVVVDPFRGDKQMDLLGQWSAWRRQARNGRTYLRFRRVCRPPR